MYKKQSFNRQVVLLCVLLLVGLFLPEWVGATNFEAGENIVITEPSSGDSYYGGGEVTIEAPIRGDLLIAGGTVFVRDTVAEDLLVVGGDVDISGYVGDDIRMAGGTMTLSGTTAGDVIVSGGTLKVLSDAIIQGNLIITGGELQVSGLVEGAMKAAGGSIDFRGSVNQKAEFYGGEVMLKGKVMGPAKIQAEKISLAEGAEFYDEVEYWREAGELDFGPYMKAGTATFNPDLESEFQSMDQQYMGMGVFTFWVIRLIGVAILLALFGWLFHKGFQRAGENLLEQPLRSTGLGFLFLLVVPFVSILLMAIVAGLPLGVFGLMNYFFVLVFGQTIAMLVLVNALNYRYQMGWGLGMTFLMALVGFVVLKVVNLIPVLGFLVTAVLVAAAIGALLIPYFYRHDEEEQIVVHEEMV
jgi:cytoskeletal protein CcmA (bactofilin family)